MSGHPYALRLLAAVSAATIAMASLVLPAGALAVGVPSTTARAALPEADAPLLVVTPAEFDYGPVEVGKHGYAEIVFANAGDAPVTVTAISVTGDGASSFRVVDDSCVGVVRAGHECTLGLRFEPTAVGIRSSTASLSGAGDMELGSVSVTGEGVASPVVSSLSRPVPRLARALGVRLYGAELFWTASDADAALAAVQIQARGGSGWEDVYSLVRAAGASASASAFPDHARVTLPTGAIDLRIRVRSEDGAWSPWRTRSTRAAYLDITRRSVGTTGAWRR